jgi:ligand-binding sensor domain-containing protein
MLRLSIRCIHNTSAYERCLPLLLIFAIFFAATGQDLQQTAYTSENTRFPNLVISDFAADTGGGMWAAGEGGIVRIANGRWSDLLNGFSRIGKIEIDKYNNFWAVTDQGIVKYDGKEQTLYAVYAQFGIRNTIQDFTFDSSGNLWIGIGQTPGGNGGALIRYDGSSWTRFDSTYSPLPGDIIVNAIKTDRDGSIWVGTQLGLVHYNKGSWTIFNTSNSGIPVNFVASLAIDPKGTKWIGFYEKGACSFDGKSWTLFGDSDSMIPERTWVTAFAFDRENNVWIGTQNKGLAKFDGKRWAWFDSTGQALPYDYVTSLAVDTGGNVLVGTWVGGLTIFDGSNWKTCNDVSGDHLPSNRVFSICFDKNSIAWIATYDGAARFDGKEWQTVLTEDGKRLTRTYDIAAYRDNSVLIASESGLALFDGTKCTITNLQEAGAARYRPVRLVTVDSANHVWVTTNPTGIDSWNQPGGGLNYYDGASWKTYTKDNSSIPSDNVSALCTAPGGNLWVGFGPYGYFGDTCARFDGKEWSPYTPATPGFPQGIATDFTVDKKGDLWMSMRPFRGTDYTLAGGCLARLAGSTWTVFDSTNSGLPSNTISNVAIDSEGVVWIGGSGGLTSFDGKSWVTYSGFESRFSKGISEITVDPKGNIWVGTEGGGIVVIKKPSLSHVHGMPEHKHPFAPSGISLNGALQFNYTLSAPASVRLEIFDLLGRMIACPLNRSELAGKHTITWQPTNCARAISHGRGTCLWRMIAGDQCFSGKIVINR